MSLILLPSELIHLILSHLSSSQILKCGQVCRAMHRICTNEYLWQERIKRDFPGPQSFSVPAYHWYIFRYNMRDFDHRAEMDYRISVGSVRRRLLPALPHRTTFVSDIEEALQERGAQGLSVFGEFRRIPLYFDGRYLSPSLHAHCDEYYLANLNGKIVIRSAIYRLDEVCHLSVDWTTTEVRKDNNVGLSTHRKLFFATYDEMEEWLLQLTDDGKHCPISHYPLSKRCIEIYQSLIVKGE